MALGPAAEPSVFMANDCACETAVNKKQSSMDNSIFMILLLAQKDNINLSNMLKMRIASHPRKTGYLL